MIKNIKIIPLWAWAILLGGGIVLGIWWSGHGDTGCCDCVCGAKCCSADACPITDCDCMCNTGGQCSTCKK
tara:strand:- start:930 stop:1142 length:213 start_codon:yes stop_codon:yes gene_type:complete